MKINFDLLIEESFKHYPKTIYKIRDWNDSFHKTIITEQVIWFASPKSLNDPFDIRVPMKIDLSEIEHQEFEVKLRESFILKNPNSKITEEELSILCKKRIIEIKKDPVSYFQKNYIDMREGNTYDPAGVFSCTANELNNRMWKEYGNKHKGFAVGFDTFELFKTIQFLYGLVEYNDEIPLHSFIRKKPDFDFRDFFLKSTKWSYEEEFRFFYVPFEKESDRAKKYTEECVTEVLLGAKFSESDKLGFINEVRKTFNSDIPIYQLKLLADNSTLEKLRIE